MAATGDAEKVALPQEIPSDERNPLGTVNRDEDIAIAIVGDRSHEFDAAVEARIVRKIDLFFIPAMVVGYGLVYYDKVKFAPKYTD